MRDVSEMRGDCCRIRFRSIGAEGERDASGDRRRR